MGSVSSFVEFGRQTSKIIHVVRNMYIEMTLYLYACFIEFNVFSFGEIHVRADKLIVDHVYYGNVKETIPTDQPTVLEERSMLVLNTAKARPPTGS